MKVDYIARDWYSSGKLNPKKEALLNEVDSAALLAEIAELKAMLAQKIKLKRVMTRR
jgi:hypothetical protein